MKKILLITFAAVCLYQGSTAQNNAKITADLQQEMMLREAGELIRISIILNQQYDQMEMRRKSSVFPTKEAKRSFVVGELKSFSKETQQGIMNLLSAMPAVSAIQSFWIANFINCYADIETIKELSLHPDVLIIGFDKVVSMLPKEKTTNVVNPTKEITYNILKVRADEVWALGYEGEGIVVAVLDTGVNYDHDDLKDNMWIHPDFPYHGYNFIDNNNDPMDDNGHGTHVAGTVAGNGTAGTQTGIAPKAKIMAVKVIDDTPDVLVRGIEFAVEHGAHILNLSLGYNFSHASMFNWDYNEINLKMRIAMVNVLEAGVIAAVAAGNEGNQLNAFPIPYNVRTPGNCPPPWLHPDQTTIGGLSAVVSVGAIDIDDKIYIDSYKSSARGPVTWQSISGFNDYPYDPYYPYGLSMGLIRPDVCAPGVDITSCGHYYTYVGGPVWSGTSMATPCVAGVMALMLSKNPELTPAEICEILETTAVRLPHSSSPKNNTFGSGRIDAYVAVQAVCPTIINLTQLVTISRTYTSCGDINIEGVTISNNAILTLNATDNINVQNVTITNNARLVLNAGGNIHLQNITTTSGTGLAADAGGEVLIDGDFDIQLGVELDIW